MLALRFLPRSSRVRSLALARSAYSMRAMIHLKFLSFFRFIAGGLFERQVSSETYPADGARSTACAALQIGRASNPSGSVGGLHCMQLRKIWSPTSQNAAALLFDFGTVDIR